MTVKTGGCATLDYCLYIAVCIVPGRIMTQRTITRMQVINTAGTIPGICKGTVTAGGVTAETVGLICTHAHCMNRRRMRQMRGKTVMTVRTLARTTRGVTYRTIKKCTGCRRMTGGTTAGCIGACCMNLTGAFKRTRGRRMTAGRQAVQGVRIGGVRRGIYCGRMVMRMVIKIRVMTR